MKNQRNFLFVAGVVALMFVAATVPLAPKTTGVLSEQSVAVKNGDTLSTILAPHSLSGQDVLEIAKLLKKEAGVRNLRADGDIIKVSRLAETEPVSKITIQSGPWRQIEFTKTDAGWSCDPISVEKDVQIVLKEGEIRDGDSFYSSGVRAGIPESVLADAYDLLAFEMDFERDMRAGQQFSILYEENFADGQFVETGRVMAVI
ncbi:MAG: hypothetical protein LBL21_03135, partial [Rickettsiales bacterium]|nr:hypothetical protein [Rickettsiales bacterium]